MAGEKMVTVEGPAHEWFTLPWIGYETCKHCGVVRRKDGGNSKVCRGPVRVGPRQELAEAGEGEPNV